MKQGSEDRSSHGLDEVAAGPGDAILRILEDDLGFMPRDGGQTHDLIDGKFGIDLFAHLGNGGRDQIDVQEAAFMLPAVATCTQNRATMRTAAISPLHLQRARSQAAATVAPEH